MLIDGSDEVTSVPRAEPVAARVTWSEMGASGAERSIMSPSALVVWKEKPETADVDGGPRTPLTVNFTGWPARISSETRSLKNTWSKSVVSPWVKRHDKVLARMPDAAAQGTVPGEVEVETKDSSSRV